jgi:DNA-binding LacI/PurR family transcriptional regulator
MASSIDVARRAGVSQSAVSRVFTPGASVSTDMRSRVLEAAAALDYRPNALARSLITGRSRVIGLILAYLNNQYYPVVLERLCAALQAHGYYVMMFIAPQANADVEEVLAEILDHQVDGIIMASAALSSSLAQRCSEQGVAVVQFNRAQDDPAVNSVTSDNLAGGRTLAQFLAAGGHRHIAYIAGSEDASTQRDREAGFRQGLAECGKDLTARDCGDYSFEGAQAAARRMFRARRGRPDAVFVANDHMAIPAMDVLRFELGLRVPEDVSVVSYDDAPQAAWPTYGLTGIRQPTGAMVDALVTLLLARIDDSLELPRQMVLSGELVVRTSARIPKGWSQ